MLRTHEELRRAGFLHPFQRHATWTDSQAFPSAPRGQVSLDSPCYHLSGRTHPAPAHEKDALSTNNFVSSLSFRTSQKRSRPSEDTDAHSVPVLLWSHTTS